MYDWVAKLECYWARNLDRMKQQAEQKVTDGSAGKRPVKKEEEC